MRQSEKRPVQLLGTVTVGPKGQVVIPVEARDRMSITPGDKLIALYVPGKKSIAFVPESELGAIIEKMGSHVEDLKQIINNK